MSMFSLNLSVHVPKSDLMLCNDNVSFSKKSALFQELGARNSELQGDAVVSNKGNGLRVHCNKGIQAVLSHDKATEVFEATKTKGLRGKLNKVVLAYSGGLDTSVIVPWLRENYGCEVVCFTADVGKGVGELEGLEQKAKASGACQLVVKDLQEEFVRDFIFPCLRAGAIYERKYLLGTSMARPVIAKVRLELTFFALNPELNVVAPWREWDITGREDAIEYAKKHNVPVPVTKKSIYSRDRNLWHLSHEGDILEDPANEPKEDMYMMSTSPEAAPDKPEYVEIGIVSGLPVSVNGVKLSPASLLSKLNEIGGKHGIGRIDMVENRLVGMKGRGVYETPGGTILFTAAGGLTHCGNQWMHLWRKITEKTNGSVRLKLYKGSVSVASRTSPNSLYREDISSFESGQIYDQADAAGFIRLYGLPMRVRAMLEKGI
ncbi:hypothetical protein NC651_019209 [Populus alba x Populus x berolinensis]|nr:hypothetical protein NC651_019209 [Populus alba x Populus x berolinensis]